MTPVLSWAIVIMCLIAILVLVVMFLRDSPARHPSGGGIADDGAVEVSAGRGSVITVRKVGGTTRVEIRPGWQVAAEEEQWEDGVALGPTPAEVTAIAEPELYREYMSPKTTATRKYEIISYVYGIGLTLPLIPGLHEQYLKEQESSGKETAKESEKDSGRGKPPKTLHIDRTVADIPMESMGDDDPPPVKLDPEEYLQE